MTTDTKIHEPITLVGGPEHCIEGECCHMPGEDDPEATCPMLDEVIVCESCSTVTRSVYGDSWGPVVNWPCPEGDTDRPHEINCHADRQTHWIDCECWCHDVREGDTDVTH